jgi:hypothetical protein
VTIAAVERWLWTQKQDVGPKPRTGHAVVYDIARKQVVLFGGDTTVDAGTRLNDTWVWDGTVWTQVADTGPSGRIAHAMAYDMARKAVVLFGGAVGFADDKRGKQETWIWNGEEWTQVADTGPGARAGHKMIYDSAYRVTVLYGGSAPSHDTWAWDGEDWTQVADTGPDAISGFGFTYDEVRKRGVLFGGWTGSALTNDTWEWTGERWLKVADTGPTPRIASGLAFVGKRIALFGGDTGGLGDAGGLVRDTWEWDGRYWTQRQDIGPPPRSWPGMTSDRNRDRVVLFGGQGANAILGDTWELAITVSKP